jgi:hypothetical protein
MATGVLRSAERKGRLWAALGTGLAAALAISGLSSAAGAAVQPAVPTARSLGTPAQRAAAMRAIEARRAAAMAARRHSAAITGTVIGQSGRPIPGACVTATGPTGAETETVPASGRFVLNGLRPGPYTLEYRDCAAPARYFTAWSGGSAWQATARPVVAAAGHITQAGPVTLHPTRSIATQMPSPARWRRMLAAERGIGLTPAAAAKTGQIAGLVTGNGHPLRGICISVFPVNGGEGYGVFTDKGGGYVVRHVPAGRYLVTFAWLVCGGGNGNWLQQIYPGVNTPFFGGKPITVRSGHTTRNINARLRLGGEISGTVTSRSGKRLRGICIEAQGTVAGGFVGLNAATGRNGSYHLQALFPGRYVVGFNVGCSASRYVPQWWRDRSTDSRLTQIRVRFAQQITGISATLPLGGTISGSVRLATKSGPALRGICIFASNSDGSVQVTAATDADGTYQVVGLPSGVFQLEVAPGCNNNGNYAPVIRYVRARLGQATRGVAIVLPPGAEISGTVTDTHGHPVGGICLTIDGGNSALLGSLEPIAPETNPDGSYDITQLAKGSYTLGFSGGCDNTGSYQPLWYNNQSSDASATAIVLATGQHATLAPQQLQPGITIQGMVTDDRGHRLTNICVGVDASNLAEIGPDFYTQIAYTDNGFYQATDLPPGQYQVDFGCGGSPQYADQWFNHRPSQLTAGYLSVPTGTATVNAVLQPAGSIAGVVTGAGGRPLANICVTAITPQSYDNDVFVIGGPGQPVTNKRGAYLITGLAAGSYDIMVNGCGSARFAQQWYRGKLTAASATPVRVRTGRETTGIDARLTEGGAISGRVVGPGGKPLANICVSAVDFAALSGSFAQTGRTGRYTLTGLNTGDFTLYFEQCMNAQTLVPVVKNVSIKAPKALSGVNATLLPGGSVSGTVTTASPAGPAAGVCVEVDSSNPLNAGAFAATGANGKYVASGLAPGTYTVEFNGPLCPPFGPPNLAPQWYNGQPTQATATTITVTAGHTTPGIGAVLQPDGAITGTVTGPGAAPVTGECVTAWPVPAGNAPVIAITRAGHYVLDDLLPGRYRVEFSSACGATGYRTQWWQNAGSAASATVVTVPASTTIPGVDATLAR